MALVEIYTRKFCPYCVRAKELLDSLGVAYKEYDIGVLPEAREDMLQRAFPRETVPQVFINNEGLGGCDELVGLHAHGKLEPLLAADYAETV